VLAGDAQRLRLYPRTAIVRLYQLTVRTLTPREWPIKFEADAVRWFLNDF
jgi:hypothetical protein